MNPKQPNKFNLIMVSAMYENGGNTIHRFIDGHPQCYVYPFESQFGTYNVNDYYTSLFPVKYRWGSFDLEGSFENDYEQIIDEELKRHVKTPLASKFKNADVQLDDSHRKETFLKLLKNKKRSRKNILEAFIVSTFIAWKNVQRSSKKSVYVGYSPILGVDADKIYSDFPKSHIIHIVRNPYSAYADTKKRPVPYSLKRYVETWSAMQLLALQFSRIYPRNFHIVKFEELVRSSEELFRKLAPKLKLDYDNSFTYPSWNGKKIKKVYPWGTILTPTTKQNKKTSDELSADEKKQITLIANTTMSALGYEF